MNQDLKTALLSADGTRDWYEHKGVFACCFSEDFKVVGGALKVLDGIFAAHMI